METSNFITCASFPMAVELLTIAIMTCLLRPPEKYLQLVDAKDSTSAELKEIKSLQNDFVKHSLLSRRLIKLDKEITSIRDGQTPKIKLLSTIGIAVRILVYVIFCLYHLHDVLLPLGIQLPWMLRLLFPSSFYYIHVWVVVFLASVASQYAIGIISSCILKPVKDWKV